MPNVQHRDIPEAQLHEPKGASTSTAGQVVFSTGAASDWGDLSDIATTGAVAGSTLVADGVGGSTFPRIQGWGSYSDSRTTVGTPSQSITTGAGNRTTLINNSASIVAKLPSDATEAFWNLTTNKIVAISEFDIYYIRVTFTAENYGGANPYIDIDLDIGGAQGIIYAVTIPLVKGGAAQKVGIVIPVFAGATFLANDGTINLTFIGTGAVDIYNTNVFVIRESKNYV